MLDCHPYVSEANKLIKELNVTNGLYNFVRTMRTKFQEIAAGGSDLISYTSFTHYATIISVKYRSNEWVDQVVFFQIFFLA